MVAETDNEEAVSSLCAPASFLGLGLVTIPEVAIVLVPVMNSGTAGVKITEDSDSVADGKAATEALNGIA